MVISRVGEGALLATGDEDLGNSKGLGTEGEGERKGARRFWCDPRGEESD
jgi:hypothetical protein